MSASVLPKISKLPPAPTADDPPEVFEGRSFDMVESFSGLVEEINNFGDAAGALAERVSAQADGAQADSDAALGYRNEARAARDAALGHAGSAAQDAATASAERAGADQAADSAGNSAGRAEAAAGAAEGLLATTVKRTSATGAAVLPEGPQEDRPDPGDDGLYIRLNSTSGKPEWFNRVKVAWQPFGTDGGELFSYAWHNGPRSSIATLTPGRIPADGQQITLLQYPDAVAAILAGKQNVVTEAVWQADPTKRNCWSLGDGASWVRVPDLNAVQAGTGKPFYLRGGTDALNGTSVGDAIRDIVGTLTPANSAGYISGTGVMAITGGNTGYRASIQAGESSPVMDFRASRVVPTADENRVKTAYGVMTVRIFTEAANAGSVDAETLATQLAVVDAKVQVLDAATGFTILYPNGGTAASPASVAINSMYDSPNPFPGAAVICVAETFYNGQWGESGWAYDSATQAGNGITASHVSNGTNIDLVRVTTGNGNVTVHWAIGGGTGHAPGGLKTIPIRVKVYKVKGVVA